MMTYIVTKEGLEKLTEELEHRTTTIRQDIAQAIKEAKEQGDLSENAEYSEAKREQAENEARITQLEAMIKDAEVVVHDGRIKGVQIGSKVTIVCDNKDHSFEIVGSNEADPAAGKISTESPFGKALMGHNAGDVVTVETPGGATECTIKDIA